MKRLKSSVVVFLLLLCFLGLVCHRTIYRFMIAGLQAMKGRKTVHQRVEEYGEVVRERLNGDFVKTGIPYPPRGMVLIGLKEEKVLEVWVSENTGSYHWLRTYPILKASGHSGPKLREGDRQVPEGLYQIESLNPNSRFHLSLRVNYPNAFDKQMAEQEGRTDLGGDIMIHGSRVSIGCLAMGDSAAEDLFVLAALTGLENIRVILSPVDFRKGDFEGDVSNMPSWTPQLYRQIKFELMKFQ